MPEVLAGDVQLALLSAHALPAETQLASRYPFSNIIITFPTRDKAPPLVFPAYISDLKDAFNSAYNQVPVYGRMDNIPVFQRTTRKITFTLGLPTFNEINSNQVLKQLSELAKGLYPTYEKYGEEFGTYIINSPPLVRIKFGNLICSPRNNKLGLLGYLGGGITVDHKIKTVGVHVVAKNGRGFLIPKAYEISINFDILHEDEVGWVRSGDDYRFNTKQQFPYKTDTFTSDNPAFFSQKGSKGQAQDNDNDVKRKKENPKSAKLEKVLGK